MALNLNNKKTGTLKKKNYILETEQQRKKQEEEEEKKQVVLRTRLEENDRQAQRVTDNAAKKIREAQNRRVDALLGNTANKTGDSARFRSKNEVNFLLNEGEKKKAQQEKKQQTEEPVVYEGNKKQKKAWQLDTTPSAGAQKKTGTRFTNKSAEEQAAQLQRTQNQRKSQAETQQKKTGINHLYNDPDFAKSMDQTAGFMRNQQATKQNTAKQGQQRAPFKTADEMLAQLKKTKEDRTEELYGYYTGENAPKFTDISGTMDYLARGQKIGGYDYGDNYLNWSENKLRSEKYNKEQEIAGKKQLKQNWAENPEAFDERMGEASDAVGRTDRVAYNLRSLGQYDKIESDHLTRKYNGRRPEDYEGNELEYDAELYDEIYGQPGLFMQLFNDPDDAVGERVSREIDTIWDAYENGTLEQLAQQYEKGTQKDRDWMEQTYSIDKEIKNDEKILAQYEAQLANLEALKNIEGDTEYHEDQLELRNEYKNTNIENGMVTKAEGGRENQIYYDINNPYDELYKEYQENAKNMKFSLPKQQQGAAMVNNLIAAGKDVEEMLTVSPKHDTEYTVDSNKYWFVTDAERAKFNSLYNAGKIDEALAFIDGLNTSLNYRKRMYDNAVSEYLASGDMGALYGIATLPENMVGGFKGLQGAWMAINGWDPEASDPNSFYYDPTARTQTIRSVRAETWGEQFQKWFGDKGLFADSKEAGEFLNQVAYSMGDNFFARTMSGGMAGGEVADACQKISQVAMQMIMSSEATAAMMLNSLEQKKDPTEAAFLALGSGLIEAATEHYSIDKIWFTDLKGMNWKELAAFMGKSFVIEGTEEIAADVLNTTWDTIVSGLYGHKDEISRKVEALVAGGMSEKDAERQVFFDYLKQLNSSFWAGGLAGLGESGARVVLNSISNTRQQWADTRYAGRHIDAKGERLTNLIQAAKGFNGDEKYQKTISELEEKLKNNGQLEEKDRRLLYKTMVKTGNKVIVDTALNEATDLVKEQATAIAEDRGIAPVEPAQLQLASQGAAKLLTGQGTLTQEERSALRDTTPVMMYVQDVQDQNRQENKLMFNEQVQQRVEEKAHAVYDTFRSLGEMTRGQTAEQAYEQMIAGTDVADEATFEAAENPQKLTYGKRGVVIVGDTVTQLRSFKNGQAVMDDGRTVDITEVEATDPTTAAIIEQARSDIWYEGEENTQNETQEEAPEKMTRADALLGDSKAEERGRAQEQAQTETQAETQAEEQAAAETQAETEERTAAKAQEETEEAPAKVDRIGALLGNTQNQQQTQGQTKQTRQQGQARTQAQAQTTADVEQTTQARQQGDVQLETAPRTTGQITSRTATEAFQREQNRRADALLGNTQQTTPRTTGQITTQTATQAFQNYRTQGQTQKSVAAPQAQAAAETQQQRGKHHYSLGSDEFWTTLLEVAQNEDEKSGNIVAEALKIRLNVKEGRGVPETRLSEKTVQRLREISEREFNESEDQRMQGRYLNPGQGTASLNGTQFGTKAFQEQISQLPAEVQPWANTIAWMAKNGGSQVELVFDTENSDVYGEEGNGRIKINLASMLQGHHPMATFAHEATHFLEHGSRQGYADLRAFVFDTLERDGVNVQQRILDKINEYRKSGVYLDLDGAIAEIVAESSEQVLTDPDLIKKMHATKPGLYEKMKSAVKRLISRIRGALGDIRQSVNRNSAYFVIESRAKEMAKLWGIAWNETAENKEQGTARSTQRAQLSVRGDSYMQAVRNGDMVTAQRLVDQRARETGYVIRGSHGTTASQHFFVFDRAKGNPEGDWGKGFYFTSNESDVRRNYANDQGPDLLAKIDRLADQLMFMDGYENLDYDERAEKAREILSGGEARIIRGALKMQNPVVLGGENQTFFEFNYNFDEENETVDDMTGSFVDLMLALEDELAENYEWEKIDTQPLWEKAMDYQGMDARTFELEAKKILQDVGDMDGYMVAGEVLRAAFERAGYDGIIDNNVAEKFNMGLEKGTTHYIVFDSSQIKQADPVTYDENGQVIPLEERFDETKKDIRYSLADQKVRNYMQQWAKWHLQENEAERDKILKKYGLRSSDISSGPVLAESRYSQYGMSKTDMNMLYMLDRDTARWEENRVEAMGLDETELGAQYIAAWLANDFDRMEEILAEKYSAIEGIIPFKNAQGYDSEKNRQIAKLIKTGNPEAIMRAGAEMAQLVPKNAVLIPIPPHTGKVTANTDTMLLAQMISKLTGRPVVNALESAEHEKRQNNKKSTAADLGFRQVAEIPDGMIPIFIDNLIASGVTAQAAHDAVGHGITIAYAKTTRGGLQGLKDAGPTFSDKYHTMLIPLEARYDMERTGAKAAQYSFRDDAAYMRAVERGDMKQAEQEVKRYAESKGYTDEAYHGTTNFGFKEFDMEGSKGTIFVAYSPNTAKTYTSDAEIREIGKPQKQINNMTGEGLYHLYARPGRQLVVEADGANWNRISWYSVIEADEEAEGYYTDSHNTKTREIAAWAKEHGYDSVRINDVYDNGGRSGNTDSAYGDIGIFFNPEDVKSADAVTYDDNGNVIPLSERFNDKKKDIRYSRSSESLRKEKNGDYVDRDGNALIKELGDGTFTAYSRQSWSEDNKDGVFKALVKAGVDPDVADKWIQDVDSIAAIIASDPERLDYKPDRKHKFKKKNSDVYKYTLDASTLCAKRILYQGTFNAIQRALPNTPLRPGDLIELSNMMREMGYQTPCGICYVESQRRKAGDFTAEFIEKYKAKHPDGYIPNFTDLTVSDGLYKLREEHPEVYRAYIAANNARGSGSTKPVQLRTDYRKDLRRMTNSMVEYLNSVGGLRIQSFSDFETPHLIDMMQALLDMRAKKLKGQAYTKVPNFAWVFGGTGIKINLSLMGEGTGLDENGNLIFSGTEGMDFNEAIRLRNRYSDNVGTILVGMNDAHIIAAMGDDRIDFIIPFHKSQWSQEELKKMVALKNYEDYQDWQNERRLTGYYKNGNPIYENVEANFMPDDYWDYRKTGTENAEEYLRRCAKDGRIPKFNQFLVDNGDGTFSLPQDDSERSRNIRKGYWKTLIDFKMYNNEGVGVPQQVVTMDVNMEEAERVLSEYEGGANTLPVAQKVVDRFVAEYKKNHPDQKQFSVKDETEADISQWMLTIPEGSLNTEAEKTLLRNYKDLRMKETVAKDKIRNYENQIRTLESKGQENLTQEEKRRIQNLRIRIQNAEGTLNQVQAQLNQVMGQEGYARMMYQQNRILNDFVYGRTTDEVGRSVEAMQKAAQETRNELEETKRRITELAQTEAVRRMRSYVGKTTAENMAAQIRKDYRTTMKVQDLADRLTGISLKMAAGQEFQDDVENLAVDVLSGIRGEGSGVLSMLKGLTLRLSESQIRELYGTNSNLKEVRSKLAGTGIKVARAEANAPVDNSLDAMWDELCDMVPSLDRDASDLDQIGQIINLVESEKRAIAGGGQMYADSLPDVMADIAAYAFRVGQDIPRDPKARAQVDKLMAYIQELAAEAQGAGDRIDRAIAQVDELLQQTTRADSRVGTLKYDIQTAIDYFDQTAKEAILREKEKKQSALIEQLKSDYAQKILKINDEWRRLIERDTNARKLADENTKIRNRVNTVAKRINKLLMKPTNTENIPEHMQGLARMMLEYVVDNDLGGRKLTKWDAKDLRELKRVLDAITARDGEATFADVRAMDPNNDLGIVDMLTERFADIEEGLEKYNDYKKNEAKLDALKRRNAALTQIQEAYSDLWKLIQSERQVALGDRRVLIEDLAYQIRQDSENSRFKGERRGFGRKARNALHQFVISGNLTPEYFFKTLKNSGLNELWEEYHRAENTNGLRLQEAKNRLAEIAEKYGYDEWDMKQQLTLHLDKGGEVKITLGQLMSLWATWNREQKIGPEMSQHLERGGFVVDDQTNDKGKARSERQTLRPKRVTPADMIRVGAMLTEEQKAFVDDVVEFLSTDMSQIGNEASMRAFGIKKFKEKYYFPFKAWNGVLSQRSDQSGAISDDSRLMHAGFTKQRQNLARNALQIGDFMDTVVNHAVAMINYSTIGVANENLQKVLNAQVKEGTNENGESFNPEDQVKRNIKAVLTEAYGQEAMKYLDELKKQLNGGAVAQERTIYDKAISLFRKNAVAGSLSVTAQQPLSYIRAAMMISPKYLAAALNPKYWKGSYAEMMKYSGVAVIKDMGRFDMNAGQSAKEYLKPDGKTSRAKAAYDWVSEKSTILPELADRMTWTRIWSAVKLEQSKLHPAMDTNSEEFMSMVAERFNDVMRKTQVYDSALVKSANMRSTNVAMKGFTSFMAEPTLTLNVLADAVQNANTEGGKLKLAKAAATFLVSALLQAAIKAGFSTGRSPDKKKTWEENFLNRFWGNFISEADPLQLIPGFNDLITLLKKGELKDDAMSTVGKLTTIVTNMISTIGGNSKNGWYRDFLEDGIFQLAQLFTNVPLKNLSRDARAIYNWINPETYAARPTSGAVIKYQALENIHEADNLIGVLNQYLGDAGYKANNAAYYDRLYRAKKEGNAQKEQDLIDFLLNGRGVSEKTINSKVKGVAKADEDATAEETIDFMQQEGLPAEDYIRSQLLAGEITAEEARTMLKKENPTMTDDSAWWAVDRVLYKKETGKSAGSGKYYRLMDAIKEGKSAGIKDAVNEMVKHGVDKEDIKKWIPKKDTGFKAAYLAATGNEKVQIKNALIMAYKAIGISEKDANEIINKWK